MKYLIVEDELHNYHSLQKALAEVEPSAMILPPVPSVAKLRTALKKQDDYDVIFSDICLEDGLCFEAFSEMAVNVPIVFTTAYDEFALQAFQAGGVDYLLKPIDEEDLRVALEKAKRMCQTPQNLAAILRSYGLTPLPKYMSRVLINNYDGVQVVKVKDFAYFECEGRKVRGFLHDGKSFILQEKSLDALVERLDPSLFFRASRHCVVNIGNIVRLHDSFNQTGEIELEYFPKLRIRISKDTFSRLRKIL